MSTTQNYRLTKPGLTGNADITVIDNNMDIIDEALLNKYETAGGTGTVITLASVYLVNNCPKTFIASASNGGAATTINGKSLYKPGTTTAPNLVSGKAYTVWYNSTGDCFFIKASAEGNTIASHVLAGDTFSNDNDTGLIGTLDLSLLISANIKSGITINGVTGKSSVVDTSDALATAAQILSGASAYVGGIKIAGTMANNGAVSATLAINGTYTIPAGYHNGSGKVTQSITTKAAATITPGTSNQAIAAGQYLSGIQTILGDADLIAANIVSGKNIFGVDGAATIESLGGKKFITGSVTSGGTSYTFTKYNGASDTEAKITVTGFDFTPSYAIFVYDVYTVILKDATVRENVAVSSIYYASNNTGIVISYGTLVVPCNYSNVTYSYAIFE